MTGVRLLAAWLLAGALAFPAVALRDVRWTIRDGEAHTPSEWMAEP